MSAIVCGKRSFFDEPSPISSSPPSAKKIRCFSPIRFSPPQPVSLVDQLREHFPRMASEVLEEVATQCGNDLQAAMSMMYKLCLEHADGNSNSTLESNSAVGNGAAPSCREEVFLSEDSSVQENMPADGEKWVELIVMEMKDATSVDDARARAARVLQSFEKSIHSLAFSETAQSWQKENLMLKEQVGVVVRENAILKRAVAIQHERQKEYDDRVQEVQQLKQTVTQYQEQLRTLEVNNYALAMHLRQAQQSNFIGGRFPPDVC